MTIDDFYCVNKAFPQGVSEMVERIIDLRSFCDRFKRSEVESFITMQNELSPTFASSLYSSITKTKRELCFCRDKVLSVLPNCCLIGLYEEGESIIIKETYRSSYGYYAMLLESIKGKQIPSGSTLSFPDWTNGGKMIETDDLMSLAGKLEALLHDIPREQYITETKIYYTKDCADEDLRIILSFLNWMQEIIERIRCSYERITGHSEKELKELSDSLITVIKGKIFEDIHDSISLHHALLLNREQAPLLKAGQKRTFIHLLKLLSLDGPVCCRNDWYNNAIEYWKLEKAEKSRIYEKPNKLIEEIILSVFNNGAPNYRKFCTEKKII